MKIFIYIWPTTYNCFDNIIKTIIYVLEKRGYKYIIEENIKNIKENEKIIIFGANLCNKNKELINYIPKKSIIINLEQLYDGSPWINKEYLEIMKNYELWDYNNSNIEWIYKNLNKKAYKIELGYVPILNNVINNIDKDIDVLFYGGLNERRLNIYNILKMNNINVIFRYNDLWDEEKDELISRSKIVLNIHYYESKLFEYARISHLLINNKFIISEKSNDDLEYNFLENGLIICEYKDILKNVIYYLNNFNLIEQISNNGYNIIKNIEPNIPNTFILEN